MAETAKVLTQGGEELYVSNVSDAQVEEMYKHSNTLSNVADTTTDKEASYKFILESVAHKDGGSRTDVSTKAKVLAAQLIPRYFPQFPHLSTEAINVQLDLCEEDDVQIRVNAIRGMPALCKDTPQNVSKIADVLGQLLLSTEPIELDAVKRAFISLLRIDIKACLASLFQHIAGSDVDLRDAAIQFLKEKIMTLADEIINPHADVQNALADNIKKVLSDPTITTTGEQKIFFDILQSLQIFKSTQEGQQKLYDIIIEHIKPLIATDIKVLEPTQRNDIIQAVFNSIDTAQASFKKGLPSTIFFSFIVDRLLPTLDQLDDKLTMKVLKNLSEVAPYVEPADARKALPAVYALLQAHLPASAESELNFSYLECLLFTFHQLASKAQGALNQVCGIRINTGQPGDHLEEDHSAKLKDLKERLNNLNTKSTTYSKQLATAATNTQSALTKAQAVTPQDEESKKNIEALKQKKATTELASKLTKNLILMASALLKSPPAFLTADKTSLSWKQPKQQNNKRPAETPANNASQQKKAKTTHPSTSNTYVPPSRRHGQQQQGSNTSNGGGSQRSRGGRGRGGGGGGGRRGRY